MSTYVVGDVQGCASAFNRLLTALAFDPSTDHIIFAGDLIARGEDSLAVIPTRRFSRRGASQRSANVSTDDSVPATSWTWLHFPCVHEYVHPGGGYCLVSRSTGGRP